MTHKTWRARKKLSRSPVLQCALRRHPSRGMQTGNGSDKMAAINLAGFGLVYIPRTSTFSQRENIALFHSGSVSEIITPAKPALRSSRMCSFPSNKPVSTLKNERHCTHSQFIALLRCAKEYGRSNQGAFLRILTQRRIEGCV